MKNIYKEYCKNIYYIIRNVLSKDVCNSIITENFYSNYEDVDGILFPMSINLVTPSIPIPGGLNLSAKSIKLNVDVSDSDFE